MGFINTAATLTLTAKLTPVGRKLMVSTGNDLIQTFSLGDSDANYYTNLDLESGQVPTTSGEIGYDNTASNSTANSVGIKSFLIVNSNGDVRKSVSTQSKLVLSETTSNGFTTISGNNLSYNVINRDDTNTDSLTNLFYSFNLSLNSTSDSTYTGATFINGGFSDTALSGLAPTKILVIGINNSTYGECIDGKTIKLELPTSAGTYDIYSTYQSGTALLTELDSNVNDPYQIGIFGYNVVGLVSDSIKTPNGGDPALSWATGYGLEKPFSQNGKQPYNLITNSNLGLTADTLIGVAYLDKGFIVITDQTIVNNYTASATTATTLTLNSVSTNVFQSITCIADRGEFGVSNNPTFESDDTPRISEVGLYDANQNLIALAKSDMQIIKNVNEFLALGVKIIL
jgi:hypothetical protein